MENQGGYEAQATTAVRQVWPRQELSRACQDASSALEGSLAQARQPSAGFVQDVPDVLVCGTFQGACGHDTAYEPTGHQGADPVQSAG